ncbi:MAG: hypothetical protein WB947_02010 [Thermoplasmata archaeon]
MPASESLHHGSRAGRTGAAVTAVVAVAVAVAVIALVLAPAVRTTPLPPLPAQVTDASGALGPVFDPGVILSGGSNSTTTFLGGIGDYSQPTGFSLPVFAALTRGPGGPTVENETALVESYFFEGGVYAIAWNGSSWLIGGQSSPGGVDAGALITIHGNTISNLSGTVATYFAGGGVWSVGWNGTAWLIGGNSSTSATLLAWDGGAFTDLSGHVVGHGPEPWVQMLAWNGAEWLVGGHGVLGLWTGGNYADLLPTTPFENGGAFSSAWNGTAWLVGGSANELVSVRGEVTTDATSLPPDFDRLALMIVAAGGGWIVAGKGGAQGNEFTPELAYWTGAPSSSPVDESSDLPASFDGGDVQGGVPAPEFGLGTVLMVGVGSYDAATGHGVGAIAFLSPSSD